MILEPAKYSDPEDHFLHRVRDLCREHGALFILDEMITGFRWHNGGAQRVYDIVPDLSTFGKALGNGFSVSALVGRRDIMEVGGLYHDRERVFLLSTTHGAESPALAAAMATMRFYQDHPVIETLNAQGAKLADGIERVISRHQLDARVQVMGKPCNLVFVARDPAGKPSQAYRTLLMQELIRHGVLGPSLVVSFSHSDEDIQQTVAAFDRALAVYRRAVDEGTEHYLEGRPSQIVYRAYNEPAYQHRPW